MLWWQSLLLSPFSLQMASSLHVVYVDTLTVYNINLWRAAKSINSIKCIVSMKCYSVTAL